MANILVLLTTNYLIFDYGVYFFIGFVIIIFLTIKLANKRFGDEKEANDYKKVSKIIGGNHIPISSKRKNKIMKSFYEWQTTHRNILKTTGENWRKRTWYFDNKDFHSFRPHYSSDPPQDGAGFKMIIFIKDAFTETLILSEKSGRIIAIKKQITEIFALKGITPEESLNFYVYIKYDFLNTVMNEGVVQFDIYKIELL